MKTRWVREWGWDGKPPSGPVLRARPAGRNCKPPSGPGLRTRPAGRSSEGIRPDMQQAGQMAGRLQIGPLRTFGPRLSPTASLFGVKPGRGDLAIGDSVFEWCETAPGGGYRRERGVRSRVRGPDEPTPRETGPGQGYRRERRGLRETGPGCHGYRRQRFRRDTGPWWVAAAMRSA